jgi:hypothetical protein
MNHIMRIIGVGLLGVACRQPLVVTVVEGEAPVFNVPDHPLVTRVDVWRCDGACVDIADVAFNNPCDCACLRAPDGECTAPDDCAAVNTCMWSVKRQNPGSDRPDNYFDAVAVPIAYGERRPENGLSRTIDPLTLVPGDYQVVVQAKPVLFAIGTEPDIGTATFSQP